MFTFELRKERRAIVFLVVFSTFHKDATAGDIHVALPFGLAPVHEAAGNAGSRGMTDFGGGGGGGGAVAVRRFAGSSPALIQQSAVAEAGRHSDTASMALVADVDKERVPNHAETTATVSKDGITSDRHQPGDAAFGVVQSSRESPFLLSFSTFDREDSDVDKEHDDANHVASGVEDSNTKDGSFRTALKPHFGRWMSSAGPPEAESIGGDDLSGNNGHTGTVHVGSIGGRSSHREDSRIVGGGFDIAPNTHTASLAHRPPPPQARQLVRRARPRQLTAESEQSSLSAQSEEGLTDAGVGIFASDIDSDKKKTVAAALLHSTLLDTVRDPESESPSFELAFGQDGKLSGDDASCESLACPAGLSLAPDANLRRCQHEICTSEDSAICCVSRADCSQMGSTCGKNFVLVKDASTHWCAGAACDPETDHETCCRERPTCITMATGKSACPKGMIMKPEAANIQCKGSVCDVAPGSDDVDSCCIPETTVRYAKAKVAAVVLAIIVAIALLVRSLSSSDFGTLDSYQRRPKKEIQTTQDIKEPADGETRVDKSGLPIMWKEMPKRYPKLNPTERKALWKSLGLDPSYAASRMAAYTRGHRVRSDLVHFRNKRTEEGTGNDVTILEFIASERKAKGSSFNLEEAKALFLTMKQDPQTAASRGKFPGIRRNLQDGGYDTFIEFREKCLVAQQFMPTTFLTIALESGAVRIAVADVHGMDVEDTISVGEETRMIKEFLVSADAAPQEGAEVVASDCAAPANESGLAAAGVVQPPKVDPEPGFILLDSALEIPLSVGTPVKLIAHNPHLAELNIEIQWALLERRRDADGTLVTRKGLEAKYGRTYSPPEIKLLWCDLEEADDSIPRTLRLKSDDEYAGRYVLVQAERPNGAPLWRRVLPGNCWVYCGTGGQWFVGTDDERSIDFKCDTGVIVSQEHWNQRFPNAIEPGGWLVFGGGQWRPTPGICFEEIDRPQKSVVIEKLLDAPSTETTSAGAIQPAT
eukprot:TRINITY_DN11751_c0_g1_i1.p1 TRINITY_DN11751_c0_g1~~TRINITY_DN11751_c0_g1_i1.p1  ORF type:complete len:991 (-),score=159.89 TRINITY_DN11751_c0_g1_i1:160-3132(-)